LLDFATLECHSNFSSTLLISEAFFAQMDSFMKSQLLPLKVEGGQTLKGSARLTASSSTCRLNKQDN